MIFHNFFFLLHLFLNGNHIKALRTAFQIYFFFSENNASKHEHRKRIMHINWTCGFLHIYDMQNSTVQTHF